MKTLFASLVNVLKSAAKSVMAMLTLSFLTVNFAQAQTAVPAPATLTSQEVAAVKNALAQNPAASMGMTSADSTLFVALLESNNQPIISRVAVTGTLCGAEVQENDSVRLFIVRTNSGFNIFNDTFYRVPNRTVINDYSQEAKLDTASVNSWFVEKQLEGRPRYRTVYEYTRHDGSVGTIVDKAMNQNGLSLKVGGDYNIGGDVTCFGGRLGIAYSISNNTGKWLLKGEIDGIYRRTRLNANANNAGESYPVFASEAKILGGISFGKHKDWRLLAGPMLGWEYYRTDSQTRYYEDGSWDEMSSKGSYVYPGALIRLEWDNYNGPVGAYVECGYRQHKSVWQNNESEKKGVMIIGAGITIKFNRQTNSNR